MSDPFTVARLSGMTATATRTANGQFRAALRNTVPGHYYWPVESPEGLAAAFHGMAIGLENDDSYAFTPRDLILPIKCIGDATRMDNASIIDGYDAQLVFRWIEDHTERDVRRAVAMHATTLSELYESFMAGNRSEAMIASFPMLIEEMRSLMIGAIVFLPADSRSVEMNVAAFLVCEAKRVWCEYAATAANYN